MCLCERVRVGRVAHLAVEGDHVAPGSTEGRERIPVGPPSRNAVTHLVLGCVYRFRREDVLRRFALWLGYVYRQPAYAAKLRHRAARVVQGLAV